MTRVTVQGDKELVKQLEKLISRAEGPGMVLAMAAGAAVVAADAKDKAPKRTQELAESIRVVVRFEKSTVLGHIGTDVFYGRFQEKGTRKMAAHPYLRPALDASEDEARREIASELKRHVVKP
jgi:HK97 gp10 family phage protein